MDKDLIKRCKKNDRRAQKAIYESLFGVMNAVCRRYCKNEDDALDVVNEGFMTVFKQIDQFGFKGSFEGWVKRIMINKSLDFLKRTKKYREKISFDHEFAEISVDNDAMNNMGIKELDLLINELPFMSRSVFNLYVIDGFPHKEIAAQLEINESTSRWHLSYARQMLKERLCQKYSYERA